MTHGGGGGGKNLNDPLHQKTNIKIVSAKAVHKMLVNWTTKLCLSPVKKARREVRTKVKMTQQIFGDEKSGNLSVEY